MKALVLDTETTGLARNGLLPLDLRPAITELYMCKADLDTGEVEAELDQLIQPDARILANPDAEEALKISAITLDMLKGKPRFADRAACVFSWLETAPVIIAHNAAFDCEMFDIEAARLSKKINWPPVLCTVEQTIHLRGYRMTLSELHMMLFDEKFADSHRAKADTLALLRCCVELRKRGEL